MKASLGSGLLITMLLCGCGSDSDSKAGPGGKGGAGGSAGTSTGGTSTGGSGGTGPGGAAGSGGASGGSAGASGGTTSTGGTSSSCNAGPACTLFVAPNGSDSGAGTESDPFANPQHAADVAQPGDVVCIRAGSYGSLALKNSGTSAAPITVKSYPGETAAIDTLGFFAGWGIEVGWVNVENLDITQTGGSPSASGECVYFHAAHDITFRGNLVHDCYGQGLLGTAKDVVIDSNRITKVGLWTVNKDPEYNKYHGIYLTGQSITIVNNVIDSNAAYGIQVAAYPHDSGDPNDAGPDYAGASNWLISNNVIAFNQNRSAIVVWQTDATNNVIQNNIFYQNGELGPYAGGTNGIDFYHSGGGHTVRNNVYFGKSLAIADTAEGTPSYSETGAINADPMFVNASGFDFHLQSGSPGLDAGTSTSAPDHDKDCAPRPAGGAIDIGAFEN